MSYPPAFVGDVLRAPVEVFTLPGRGTCWRVDFCSSVRNGFSGESHRAALLLVGADPERVQVWTTSGEDHARAVVASWPPVSAQLSLFDAVPDDEEERRNIAAYDMDPATSQPFRRDASGAIVKPRRNA